MKITKQQDGSTMVVALEGRLDMSSAPELDKELETGLGQIKELILDCSKMEYITSSGLRVLLKARRNMAMGGELIVRNASDIVKEVFEVTGFTEFVTVE
ncbi:MAG: STAS domain-containing protein [Clostridia bacterium]|nr:STAS domain-containing protein [Clostridia bacterium]